MLKALSSGTRRVRFPAARSQSGPTPLAVKAALELIPGFRVSRITPEIHAAVYGLIHWVRSSTVVAVAGSGRAGGAAMSVQVPSAILSQSRVTFLR